MKYGAEKWDNKNNFVKKNKSQSSVHHFIALSRVFISFEAFRLTLIKKDRQNGEHRKGRVFIAGAEL